MNWTITSWEGRLVITFYAEKGYASKITLSSPEIETLIDNLIDEKEKI